MLENRRFVFHSGNNFRNFPFSQTGEFFSYQQHGPQDDNRVNHKGTVIDSAYANEPRQKQHHRNVEHELPRHADNHGSGGQVPLYEMHIMLLNKKRVKKKSLLYFIMQEFLEMTSNFF